MKHLKKLLQSLPDGCSVTITHKETETVYTGPQTPLVTSPEEMEIHLLPKVRWSPANAGYAITVGKAVVGIYPTEAKAREAALEMSGFLAE